MATDELTSFSYTCGGSKGTAHATWTSFAPSIM